MQSIIKYIKDLDNNNKLRFNQTHKKVNKNNNQIEKLAIQLNNISIIIITAVNSINTSYLSILTVRSAFSFYINFNSTRNKNYAL